MHKHTHALVHICRPEDNLMGVSSLFLPLVLEWIKLRLSDFGAGTFYPSCWPSGFAFLNP